jgi:hypothetical protein
MEFGKGYLLKFVEINKKCQSSQQPSPKGTELVREIKQDVLTRPP